MGEQVIADVPCVGCGYNLRMSPVEGRCTECGEAVANTLRMTILRWGGRYFRGLSRSVMWVAILAIAMPVEYFGGMILIPMVLRLKSGMMGDEEIRLMQWAELGDAAIFLLLILAFAFAVWMATRAPMSENVGWRGWLIRLGAVMPLGAGAIMIAILLMTLARLGPSMLVGPETERVMEKIVDDIVLLMPILLGGFGLCADQAGVRMADIYRRSGMAAKVALAQWSIRIFSWGLLVTMGTLLFMLLLDRFDRGAIPRVDFGAEVMAITGAGLTGLGWLGMLIALSAFSVRMKRLAPAADGAMGGLIGAETVTS